jgi:hypothetical protein
MTQGTFQGCYFENDTLPGSKASFLACYNADGSLHWLRDMSSPDGGASIQVFLLDTMNGAFYTSGGFVWSADIDTCTVTASGHGVYLAKWNLDGSCLWARTIATSVYSSLIPPVHATGMAMDDSGELLICMRADAFGSTQADGQAMSPGSFLGKYDAEGELLWLKPFTSYGGITKNIDLQTILFHGDRFYGHGRAGIPSGGDTTTIDTIQIVGRQGSGYILVSLDPTTGVADWFRLDGFPNGPGGPERMAIDSYGNIVCVGSYGSMAVFGQDTLVSFSAYAKGYITKYTSDGNVVYSRSFEGSDSFGFTAVEMGSDDHFALTGGLRGEIVLSGTTYAATSNRDLFVSRHDAAGDPTWLILAGGALGQSVRHVDGGLMVTGQFPVNIPAGTTTIGVETYTSHGWEDIVLARTGLPTSIAPKSMGDDRLLIYANPNQGSFRLVLPEAVRHAQNLVLRVYDGTGRLLHQQKLHRNEERPKVDVWDVSPGFYMVTLSDGHGTYSGNMVVE